MTNNGAIRVTRAILVGLAAIAVIVIIVLLTVRPDGLAYNSRNSAGDLVEGGGRRVTCAAVLNLDRKPGDNSSDHYVDGTVRELESCEAARSGHLGWSLLLGLAAAFMLSGAAALRPSQRGSWQPARLPREAM